MELLNIIGRIESRLIFFYKPTNRLTDFYTLEKVFQVYNTISKYLDIYFQNDLDDILLDGGWKKAEVEWLK